MSGNLNKETEQLLSLYGVTVFSDLRCPIGVKSWKNQRQPQFVLDNAEMRSGNIAYFGLRENMSSAVECIPVQTCTGVLPPSGITVPISYNT